MHWLLIFGFLAICLWLILMGLRQPGKIYEYPFLAGATFLGFIGPQLPALANDPFLPPGAFAKTAVFTILCAAACGFGWIAGNRPLVRLNWSFEERRLQWVAAVLSLIGAFFYFKISRLPAELTSMSQWTGLPVAYLFFAQILTYGFAIAILSFVWRPSWFVLGIIAFDSMFLLDRMLIAGRRADTVAVILTIALALWFQRSIAAPRTVYIAGVLAAALAISSTGDYRSLSMKDDGPAWSAITEIDVWSNFLELLDTGSPEMRNAVFRIDFADRSQAFDYGLFHWNVLVFNYVPAQIVGTNFKESLYVEIASQKYAADYVYHTGSTETGMSDAFGSFWYLGALKFFVIAYLLGRIYWAAAAGSTLYQLVYILSVTPAMHAITHHTQWIFSAWVHMGLLFLPFLALAKVNPSGHPGDRASANERGEMISGRA